MSWPLIIIGGLLLLAAADSSETRKPGKCVPKLPPPSRFKRVLSERRIREEDTEEDDYGLVRRATLYTPCDWEPMPWSLSVWTDPKENADVFALVPHPDAAEAGLRVSVYWSDSKKPGDKFFRDCATQVDRDERFTNRLIHRYKAGVGGVFLIEVCVQGETVRFYYRPKVTLVLTLDRAALPPAPPPNPFEERLDCFILLQEQYEAAKEQALKRGLPKKIELAALDELERVFQDEVSRLEEGADGGR